MEEKRLELQLTMGESGIVSNAVEMQELLIEKLKAYKYVVSKDNYKDAKKDRAKLNNLSTAVANARTNFEKKELQSWLDIKEVIMDMEKLIKGASSDLDKGIKAVEKVDNDKKMANVKESYDIAIIHYPFNIDFEKLYDRKKYDAQKWTESLIENELTKILKTLKEQWEMLSAYMPDDEVEREQVKHVFETTLSSAKAKAKCDELKKLHEKVKLQNRPVEALKPIPRATSQEVPKQVANEPTEVSERIVVEFIATRPFYDAMNKLVAQYKPSCKVLEREKR